MSDESSRYFDFSSTKDQTVHFGAHQVPPVVMYCLLATLGLLGVLGNLLLLRTTHHPDLKTASYRVYLAFLSVVCSVDLAVTIAIGITDQLQLAEKFMATNATLCKLGHGLAMLFEDLSIVGLLGLALDRYVALVLPRFKSAVCTNTSAKLMCVTTSMLCGLISISYGFSFGVHTNGQSSKCFDNNELPSYFYAAIISTAYVPYAAVLYFAGHTALVIARRPPASEDQQQRNNDRETGGPLLALVIVSWLTGTPMDIVDLIQSVVYKRISRSDLSELPLARDLVQVFPVVILLTSFSLSCKLYVLLATSPYFRRLARQSIQRGTRSPLDQPIELPRDRRVLTALTGGPVLEIISGQVVDLYAFNAQRGRREISREVSSTSSMESNVTCSLEEDEQNFTFTRRHGSVVLRGNGNDGQLDKIVEMEDSFHGGAKAKSPQSHFETGQAVEDAVEKEGEEEEEQGITTDDGEIKVQCTGEGGEKQESVDQNHDNVEETDSVENNPEDM